MSLLLTLLLSLNFIRTLQSVTFSESNVLENSIDHFFNTVPFQKISDHGFLYFIIYELLWLLWKYIGVFSCPFLYNFRITVSLLLDCFPPWLDNQVYLALSLYLDEGGVRRYRVMPLPSESEHSRLGHNLIPLAVTITVCYLHIISYWY